LKDEASQEIDQRLVESPWISGWWNPMAGFHSHGGTPSELRMVYFRENVYEHMKMNDLY
jgi:hypothetical protein